jgi:hypothetical protein
VERIRNAILVVLVFALLLRIAWALVMPVVPAIVVLAVLLMIFTTLFRRPGG